MYEMLLDSDWWSEDHIKVIKGRDATATNIIQGFRWLDQMDDDDDNSTAGWYTIVNESQTFDLIALQDVKELLGQKNLSAGKYTQIRLTVEKAEITINNSGEIEVHDLKIPSNKVKLIKSFWIYEDETTVLTLDFDVYESVHKAGKDKYIMRPTIKVIQAQ